MQTITVIGLGTMGHGIAQTFAVAGFDVRLFDENETARENLATENINQIATDDKKDSKKENLVKKKKRHQNQN